MVVPGYYIGELVFYLELLDLGRALFLLKFDYGVMLSGYDRSACWSLWSKDFQQRANSVVDLSTIFVALKDENVK